MYIKSLAKSLGLLCVLALLGCAASKSHSCMFQSDDAVYDLRPLAQKDFWRYEYPNYLHHASLITYLSVCHPLRNLPESSLCSKSKNSQAAVCIEFGNTSQVDALLPSIGSVDDNGNNHDTALIHEDIIEYKYHPGVACEEGRPGENHTTTLTLICPDEGVVETDFPVLMEIEACHAKYAWITKAACPLKKEPEIYSCSKIMEGHDEPIDLRSLHTDTFYKIDSEIGKYEINICGAIKGGSCVDPRTTLCNVTDPQNPKVISTTEDMEVETIGPILSLHYNNNITKNSLQEGQRKIGIHFLCDKKGHDTEVSFFQGNETNINFVVETHAICKPEEVNCVLTDWKDNVYDLRPLHKESNWMVKDNRKEYKDVLYHINICGPLKDTNNFGIDTTGVGALQTSLVNKEVHSMGNTNSDPIFNDDGTITMLFTGGSPCTDAKYLRSTRITFICDDYEHRPVFIEETSTCHYVFEWRTPLACPRHVVTSKTCTVTDPLYGHTFDLTPLRNTIQDYSGSDGTTTFYINPCGTLVGDYYGLDARSSVAITNDVDPDFNSTGIYPADLTFNDGTLIQKFTDGSFCKRNETYSTQVFYLCDHNATDTSEGPTMLRHMESCQITLFWRTHLVCPQHKIIDCSYTDKDGQLYDLNALSSPSINSRVFSSSSENKYILNICRSVVHSKSSRCPYTSASCVMDLTKTNPAVNMGEVGSGLYMKNNLLRLKYENGDVCNSKTNYSTEVIFECDEEGNVYNEVKILKEHDCEIVYFFKTASACPVKTTLPPSSPSLDGCTVTNPFTDHKFDLTPLSKPGGYIISKKGTLMKFNVCGSVVSCPSSDDGSCISGEGGNFVSSGKVSTELKFIFGALILKYKGGSRCENGQTRTTLVSFHCGAKEAHTEPVLAGIDESSCTYYVNWFTDYACEKRLNCFAKTKYGEFDMSPLIKHYDNYKVAVPNTTETVHLNLCAPLNHADDLHCSPGSSICMTNSTNPSSRGIGLGKPVLEPHARSEGSVSIDYPFGDKCTAGKMFNYASKIEIKCDRSAGKGYPQLLKIHRGCLYKFVWYTSLVCPHEVKDHKETCVAKHHSNDDEIYLHDLHRTEAYRIPFASSVYYLNICGSACGNGTSVCNDLGKSYGLTSHSKMTWIGNKLSLLYFGGEKCPKSWVGKHSTEITFICDPDAGLGYPEPDPIMKELDCKARFTWRTNVTCTRAMEKEQIPTTTTEVIETTQNPLETTTLVPEKPKSDQRLSIRENWLITLLIVLILLVVVAIFSFCLRKGYIKRFTNYITFLALYPNRWCFSYGKHEEEMEEIV